MLKTLENVLENAHNSPKCSQLSNTLTTPENAHNSKKKTQLSKLLTSPKNVLENVQVAPCRMVWQNGTMPVQQYGTMAEG